ncbi:hypothetical protein BKA70DRAFT_1566923 [Coprinopsis sp. MPI-PUGE-AT-0042]|nr:hypothetical protein BKA70DRAFT_1566923 [Coprinopsis sp. MPI-PUGE-AT-0042]
MRFATVFALAGAAASVSASSLLRRQGSTPPACAVPCLTDTSAPFGDCARTDNACLCNNPEFVAFGTECVTAACEGADREAAFAFSRGLCEQVGVTLTSSPAPEETPAPEASGSADPVVSGSATTEAVPTDASPSPRPSAPATGTTSVRPTGSGSGSASGSAPSGSTTGEPADDGAASTVRVSLAAVAAMGLAVFAL